MKYINYTFLLLFALTASSCSKNDSVKPAHLRIISAIPNTKVTVIVQSKKHDAILQSYQLNEAIAIAYKAFPAGYYHISVKAKDKVIFKRTYVLEKDGYYTMVITGLIADNPGNITNSVKYNLMHIFSGSEARVKNNYLPIGFLLLDSFFGNMNKAILRVTNIAPNAPKITIKVDNKALVKALTYPKTSKLYYVKPGAETIQVYYGDVNVAVETIQTKAGYIYSIFVTNGSGNNAHLAIKTLKTPSIALMQSSKP